MHIENKISDLNQSVKNLYLQGKYDDALVAAEQSNNLSRSAFGESHPDYATKYEIARNEPRHK